ncbi:FAD-dependent oxidoreductase [Dechloromonas sp. HYN0024]|uniref:FAD-dependent oxidoreductase n=1 Tax=Dechloromonas sp. HYN0024 TaxID=2231055 RepID=UPI000E43630C|nr:FAD-dependent oxidoreductase [Dechloromonas sp. HYN0024]AXS80426.1 NAD(P)/FAD-dependent oxidoreductase [Dechloromonas sp. HYN0024]
MKAGRRQFLLAAGLLPLFRPLSAAGERVVIIGGGWGGLSAASHLRRLAPELDVVLVDRQPAFTSFALSNRWLVDPAAGNLVRHDYARLAQTWGYRFVQASVEAIDRAQRVVTTATDRLPYDWLILSPGIRENFAAWQLTDPLAVAELRQRHSGAMLNAADLPLLKKRLAGFTGGDLLMTIPPAPYRCPPAPYERAMLIAWWLKTQNIRGKLVIIDPNPVMPAFKSILLERFKDQITYLDHAKVRQVDVARKTVSTDIDEIRFDEALLSPPQEAADLLWQAGLIRRDEGGQATGWGAQAGFDFRSPEDERVFIIGDAAGLVSPLFGLFPKTGHVANRMGAIVARQIAVRVTGKSVPVVLPESVCYVLSSVDPLEQMRIETTYRQRVDGFLMQQVKQIREPNPAGEDVAWAAGMYRDFLQP